MKSYSEFSKLHQQRGGTLLGLIIGLVIGLAIAVVVALLITRSGTPVNNKSGKAGDAPITQVQDPNRPLYSNKELVKEAAKDMQKASDTMESTTASKTDAKSPAKPEHKPDLNAEAKSTNANQEKAQEPIDEKYIYFLQAGAFHDVADAEASRGKLALIGFESKISEKTVDTQKSTVYILVPSIKSKR